jgi:Protein of unknown function (DUF3040).
VALSDEEQMLLKQIEASLAADEPRLVNELNQPMGAPLVRGRLAVGGIVIMVLSIIVLIAGGVVAGLLIVGLLSFVGMMGGAFMLYRALEPLRIARANPLHAQAQKWINR